MPAIPFRALSAVIAALLPLAPTGSAPTPAPARDPLFVPVLRENVPDPFVLPVGGRYLMYSTNHDERNVPVAVSRDLVRWARVKDERDPKLAYDAMPTLPAWAKRGFTWAPEVIALNGGYVMNFTARHAKSGLQCIGVATAADPLGPFVSSAPEPLVCQFDQGGTIDGHTFRDADGQLYFYYKNDGNNPRVLKPARIYVQRMTPDGLKLTGEPVPLVRDDKHWEWRVVEAPTMVRHAGGYTLFFSANHFGWEADQDLSNYATGYATCRGPMGPCTDARENPILRSYRSGAAGCLSGPGHPAVFEAGGRRFVAFHAWAANAGCRPAEHARHLYVAPLSFKGVTPQIGRSLRAPTAR